MNITQSSFEKIEEVLLEELRVLGGQDNFEVDQSLDSSLFGSDSDPLSSDGEANQTLEILVESETSAGDNKYSSEGTDDPNSDNCNNNDKMVSFNNNPTIHLIPRISPYQRRKVRSTTQRKSISRSATSPRLPPPPPPAKQLPRTQPPSPPNTTTSATTTISVRRKSTRQRNIARKFID